MTIKTDNLDVNDLNNGAGSAMENNEPTAPSSINGFGNYTNGFTNGNFACDNYPFGYQPATGWTGVGSNMGGFGPPTAGKKVMSFPKKIFN